MRGEVRETGDGRRETGDGDRRRETGTEDGEAEARRR